MARKRLNTNLLIALTVVIAVTLLVGYLATRYYLQNPERAVARAVEAEESGEWQRAADQWGKAFRATQNSEYGLKVVDNVMRLTADEEKGRENLRNAEGQLQRILSEDPKEPAVLRALIRYYNKQSGFLSGRLTRPTREAREAAKVLLEVEPGDAEAGTFYAATTLDLSGVTNENISEEEAEQARQTLMAISAQQPLDGTALTALRGDLSRRLQADGISEEDVDGVLQTYVSAVDAAAAAAETAEPREGLPTDTASAHMSAGLAYELAGSLLNEIEQRKVARQARDAGVDVDVVAARDAGLKASEPLKQKAIEQLEKAVAATDSERDLLTSTYGQVRQIYADALVRRNERDQAIEVLTALVEERPWDVSAAAQVSEMLRQVNRFEKASVVLADAFEVSKEPLPGLEGHDGVAVLTRRAVLPLELADSLLRERRALAQQGDVDAKNQQQLLSRARTAFAAYENNARALSLGSSPAVTSVEGQLAIARGDVFEGLDQLERALRTYEQAGNAGRTQQLELLRLLADVNRQAGQTGGEIEHLARAFALGGNVNDGLRLAELYRVSGQDGRSRDVLARLMPIMSSLPEPVQRQLETLAAAVAEEGTRDEAYADLPETTDAERLAKLRLAAATNRQDEALRLAKIIAGDNPENVNLNLLLAQIQVRTGDTEAAIATLSRFPDDESSQALLERLQRGTELTADDIADPVQRKLYEAQLAEQANDLEQAVSLARSAVDEATDPKLKTTVMEAVFGLLLKAERFDEADELADQLAKEGADGVDGQTYRIRTAMAKGDLDRATEQATSLAEKFPRMAQAQLLKTEVYRQVGRSGEAADSAAEALRLAPTDERTMIEAVAAFVAAGRVNEARQTIEQGLRQRPNSPRLLQIQENYQLQFGDPSAVLAKGRKEVQENADDPGAYQRLASSLAIAVNSAARSGNDAQATQYANEAVELLLETIEKFDSDSRYLRTLATVALKADEANRQAVDELFTKVMTPGDAQSLIGDAEAVQSAALFFANTGGVARAETAIREHIKAMPADTTRERRSFMLLALSQLLVEQGDTSQAIAVLDGFEDLPMVSARVVALLAARATEGDDEALAAMREAIKADTTPPTALTAAALAELRRGNAEEAVTILERSMDSSAAESASTLYLLAVAIGQTVEPDLDRAADLLERAARLAPGNYDALRNLARIRRQQGDREAAEVALRQILDGEPADVQARLALAQMQLAKSPPDFGEADRYFRGADGTSSQESPILLLSRARMEADRNRFDDAASYARRALEQSLAMRQEIVQRIQAGGAQPGGAETLAANTPVYLNGYLDLLLRADRVNEALREVRIWGDRLAGDEGTLPWWLQAKEAEALARAGRTRDATQAYTRAYEAAAAANAGTAQLERVVLDMGRRVGVQEAYVLLKDRVEPTGGEPVDPVAAVTASRLYQQAGDTTRALDLLNQVRQALVSAGTMNDQRELVLNVQEGTLHLNSEPPQLEAALANFRRARELLPDDVAVNNNLAYTLTLLGREPDQSDEAAIRRLEEAVERGRQAVDGAEAAASRSGGGTNPSVVDTLGWAEASLAMKTDDADLLADAARLLRGARDDAERDGEAFPEVYLHLALTLEAAGDLEPALEAAEVGLEVVRRLEADEMSTRQVDLSVRRQLGDAIGRLKATMPPADAQE